MNKGNCMICKKKLKRDIGKPIHRKCWLQMRDFDERYLDTLFCVNKQDSAPAKSMSIKPVDTTETDFLDEMENEIRENQPILYELDDSITYEIDIGGNLLLI